MRTRFAVTDEWPYWAVLSGAIVGDEERYRVAARTIAWRRHGGDQEPAAVRGQLSGDQLAILTKIEGSRGTAGITVDFHRSPGACIRFPLLALGDDADQPALLLGHIVTGRWARGGIAFEANLRDALERPGGKVIRMEGICCPHRNAAIEQEFR